MCLQQIMRHGITNLKRILWKPYTGYDTFKEAEDVLLKHSEVFAEGDYVILTVYENKK